MMSSPTDPLDALLDADLPRKREAAEWGRAHEPKDVLLDRDWWSAAAEFGFQGLTIPVEYGGSDLPAVDSLLAFEGLGLACENNGAVFALASQAFPSQMSLVRSGDDVDLHVDDQQCGSVPVRGGVHAANRSARVEAPSSAGRWFNFRRDRAERTAWR